MPTRTTIVGGTAALDSKGFPTGIQVRLDPAGIGTNSSARDKELRSLWFQVARFGSIMFVERGHSGSNPASFDVDGDLTMHGVTRRVTLRAHLEAHDSSRIRFSATAAIDRRQFDIDAPPALTPAGALIVGYIVDISIDTEWLIAK
jgi:polyisoprenoid-binding protein YceI